MTDVFTLSIEPVGEKAFQDGFHLGTDLALAKRLAAERWHGRNNFGMPTATVAIFLKGKMVDCYDGQWNSERDFCEDGSEG